MKAALSTQVKSLITHRKKAKNARDRKQGRLIENREIHKASIEAKLKDVATGNQFENFRKCGREEIYRSCKNCGSVETFYFACNRKWCPLCNYKIGNRRAAELKIWASKIQQPKHLVLTMRNFAVLTRNKITAFQQALLKLRRAKLLQHIKGGCTSIEITNSGEGWHLHAHSLLDVRWLDMQQLSVTWGKLVGQEFGIVKIKDVRGTEYVQEVSKYVAKGSELATWPAESLWEFICAIRGKRFFFAFGSLRQLMPEVRKHILSSKPAGVLCDCGCGQFRFETEAQSILNDIRRSKRRH